MSKKKHDLPSKGNNTGGQDSDKYLTVIEESNNNE